MSPRWISVGRSGAQTEGTPNVAASNGGKLDSNAHAPGTFEHLTCLRGGLSISVDAKIVDAEPGDTLRYRADRSHCIANRSDQETEAFLLVAQPSQYREAPPTA